jgi:NADH-quinone oxidoreductase subunit L
VAVAQTDIKKVLAYSTVSQLGYMFLAVGSGAYVAAIFHMVTHAFFKALLFLGSGSVIHGMHDEQDMRRMGALRKLLPITSATFIIGWLAIAGVPPFAGFWSKDEILLFAWEKSPALWAVGLVTALLTAFYMSRQVFMVFFGDAKWDRPLAEAAPELAAEREAEGVHEGHGVGPAGEIHPHESGWHMTLPLVVLSGLAIVGGGLNVPIWDVTKYLEHWLEPVIHFGEVHPHVSTGTKVGLAAVATAAAVAGILGAAAVYLKGRRDIAAKVEQPLLRKAWGYDAAISAFMGGPGTKLFDGITNVDKTVVDGAVNGVGTLVGEASSKARLAQTGFVRNYALGLTIGVVVVAGLLLSKAVF